MSLSIEHSKEIDGYHLYKLVGAEAHGCNMCR